jgi:4-alpha-glucanotransferase
LAKFRSPYSCPSRYFSAYRIDHILGFFRIWELPGDSKSGLLGRFRPSIPIRRAELEGRGIWDFDRLCNPYVTHSLLEKTFGEGEPAADVAARYFVDGPGRRYRFRSQYASEAALWNLRPRPGLLPEVAEEAQRIWKGLLALRQNVVLLRDAGDGDLFYPVSRGIAFLQNPIRWIPLRRTPDVTFYCFPFNIFAAI